MADDISTSQPVRVPHAIKHVVVPDAVLLDEQIPLEVAIQGHKGGHCSKINAEQGWRSCKGRDATAGRTQVNTKGRLVTSA